MTSSTHRHEANLPDALDVSSSGGVAGRPQLVNGAYRSAVRQRVAARTPMVLGLLAACAAVATFLEILRFPERRSWMLGADAIFLVIIASTFSLVRARPRWSIPVVVIAANVIGVVLNAYHAIVHAEVAMCVWTLTALVCSAAAFLPWGWRAQALASVGTVLGYGLMFGVNQHPAALAWAAGGAYLAWVVGLSILGAALFEGYMATDFTLAATLAEREARLQSYFDLSTVGTAILSPGRGWIEVNEQFCRILGYRREQLLRTAWADLIPAADRGADREQFDAVLRGDRAATSREGGLLGKDGRAIHGIVSVRALPGPLGVADHLMVTGQALN